MKRNRKLFFFENHMSPRELAVFIRRECRDVGRLYETYGDVWDADKSTVKEGLLHLILDELEILNGKAIDELDVHKKWLRFWHGKIIELIRNHESECERISKFCDLNLLRGEERRPDIHYLSKVYRNLVIEDEDTSPRKYSEYVDVIRKQVERLKRVRSLGDLENLYGIGPKVADSIRLKMAERRNGVASDDHVPPPEGAT